MQAKTTQMLHLRVDDEAAVVILHPQTVSIMVNSVTLSLSDEKQIMNGIFSSATLNILLFGTSASYLEPSFKYYIVYIYRDLHLRLFWHNFNMWYDTIWIDIMAYH